MSTKVQQTEKKKAKRSPYISGSHKPNPSALAVSDCYITLDGESYRIGTELNEWVSLVVYCAIYRKPQSGILFWMKTGRLPKKHWFYLPALKMFFIQNRPYPPSEFPPLRMLKPKPERKEPVRRRKPRIPKELQTPKVPQKRGRKRKTEKITAKPA